jgi:hypothetical protein
MLRGYNVPLSTKTTAEMSPLSALAGVGSGALGLFTKGTGGETPYDAAVKAFKELTKGGASDILGYGSNTPVSNATNPILNQQPVDANEFGLTNTED